MKKYSNLVANILLNRNNFTEFLVANENVPMIDAIKLGTFVTLR